MTQDLKAHTFEEMESDVEYFAYDTSHGQFSALLHKKINGELYHLSHISDNWVLFVSNPADYIFYPKPQPEKSYAKYLDKDGDFNLGRWTFVRCHDACGSDVDRKTALREWLNDDYEASLKEQSDDT